MVGGQRLAGMQLKPSPARLTGYQSPAVPDELRHCGQIAIDGHRAGIDAQHVEPAEVQRPVVSRQHDGIDAAAAQKIGECLLSAHGDARSLFVFAGRPAHGVEHEAAGIGNGKRVPAEIAVVAQRHDAAPAQRCRRCNRLAQRASGAAGHDNDGALAEYTEMTWNTRGVDNRDVLHKSLTRIDSAA